MWIINCLLLMLGSVSAVMGISFYFRNRQAAGKIRFYILFYGLCSAVWCICYGMIGISDNLELCEQIRKVGVAGINGFLLTEVFLVSEMSGAKAGMIKALRVFATLISCFLREARLICSYAKEHGLHGQPIRMGILTVRYMRFISHSYSAY